MIPVVLLGAGGHARSCLEAIESGDRYSVAGFVIPVTDGTRELYGYPVLASDEDIDAKIVTTNDFLIAVGGTGSQELRMTLFNRMKALGVSFASPVASSAYVSSRAIVGTGTITLHGAVINAGAQIGENCIINTGSIIEHDVVIADHVHVSTGALINGGCEIGGGAFIGSGAVLKQGLHIAAGTMLGAGCVAVKDIVQPGTYVGIPARRLK